MSQGACYHCGLPIPEDVHLSVVVGGAERALCCNGCQAVAEAIVANGLDDYYRHRDSLPESPREAMPAVVGELKLYDHDDFQKSFVRALGEDEKEASLMLEGITCAACVWLNEQHVAKLSGVTGVDINYASRRARVRWDDRKVHLSDILAAIRAIGYRAHPYDAARHEEIARRERKDMLWRLWVAGFGMMQVMMYAIPVYIAGDGDMSKDMEGLMRWASLLLTLPVVIYSSAPFFRNAWRDFRFRRVGMDVPVAIGVGVAFTASVWATISGSGEVYFDSVTMFVFFLLGGRFLEMVARQKAVSVTEALAKLMPAFALRLPAGASAGGATEQVLVSDLHPGDRVLVKPGETIPADGRVVAGVSAADEALLSGESRPVAKRPGDLVTGGAQNVESPLVVEVEEVGEGTRLSAIVRLMERAAAEKPRLVEIADRVAGRFIGAILPIAAATALGWAWYDPSQALWISVSVLVVTCPCALSLATPIALTVASGALARHGVLVTRGHAIETLARATCFVFDKTGTLTLGQMRVEGVHTEGGVSAEDALRLAASLEQASAHPIARALERAAEAQGLVLASVDGASAMAGRGVAGRIDGGELRCGRPDYVAELHGQALPAHILAGSAASGTRVALGDGRGWLAFFDLDDDIRPGAAELVASLRSDGCRVVLLSGDAPEAAQRVADTLGIVDVRAGVSPQGKHDAVAELQGAGEVVAMVGDGVNDAPVLAQAQVSIAMGGGAPLARTQADLVLLSDSLVHLRFAVGLVRKALRIIRENLWWSVGYNVVAVPLAISGHVTPWLAGIVMSASSLLVVLNSLRLQRQPRVSA